jgi:drug/metabolite transporter (DMT)-like permease
MQVDFCPVQTMLAPILKRRVSPTTDSTRHAHARAIGLLLIASVFWSLGGLLIKGVEWSALAIAATRSAIAAATIVAFMRGRLHFTWSRWQVGAAIAYAGTVLLFVLATKLTTAANAILLQYTAPIYIALAAPWFLGEPSRRRDWIAIVVTLAGMSLFFFDQLSARGMTGNVVAIASGVAFAALTLLVRRQKDGSVVESIVLGNVIAAVCGLPFVHAPFPDARGWALLAALGVVQLGISYILYAAAMKHATAMEAALVPMLEPVLNPVWVLLVRGERPGPYALVGGLVVLGVVAVRTVVAVRERSAT